MGRPSKGRKTETPQQPPTAAAAAADPSHSTTVDANPSQVSPTDVEFITEVIWADENDRYSSGELAPKPKPVRVDPCGCQATADRLPCCIDESCVLFACQEECPKDCEAGDYCQNRRISRKEWKQLEIYNAGNKGKGLRTLEDIKAGEFVIEYVGRAVRKAFLERLFSKYKNERMLYIMALDADTFIDARSKGGTARYINHSCEPNCVVQRWKVRGVLRAAIFATKDIPAGTELSFDYQWERKRGRAPTKCYCNAPSCRGTLEVAKSLEEQEEERQLVGHWKKQTNTLAPGRELMNRCICIMSAEHQEYFAADVVKYDETTKKHLVMYRNLQEVWEDLSKEDWMLLDEEGEQLFVIAKKSRGNTLSPTRPSSLLGDGAGLHAEHTRRGGAGGGGDPNIKNYMYVQTPVKDGFLSLGLLERCQRNCHVNIAVTRHTGTEAKSVDVTSEESMEEFKALADSQDGSVWKLTITGSDIQKASYILGKNIEFIRRKFGLTEVGSAGQSEEVVIPRCITDGIKRKLPNIRESFGSSSTVNISFVPSESKSKQFAKLLLEAPLKSDLDKAKTQLWPHLLAACMEANAPFSPQGIHKDLGFFGGELSSEQFQLLVEAEKKNGGRLSQECHAEDLRHSSFFQSFESTQRCTVWVQSENDMGRIDRDNKRVKEAVPNGPRKIYFGCEPQKMPKLWALVETRAAELARGVRYVHLGADRTYQQLMMRKGCQFFNYIQNITGASVHIDPMTGDHLRIDGRASGNEVIQIGDWDSEQTLQESDRAALAEELIKLQIELYRDHCIRYQGWIFGRDWSLAATANESTSTSSGPSSPTSKSPRPSTPSFGGKQFEAKAIVTACIDIAEISVALEFESSVAIHATIILYRYLNAIQKEGNTSGVKIRELLLAALFMANKAQKVVKYKSMGNLLEAAYQVFYPGARFDRKNEEVGILENRVIAAEEVVLETLDYDIFWKGLEWIMHAAVKGGHLAEPLARNAVELTASGPVLAAGPNVWLKYGPEYVFAAAAGLLSFPLKSLFISLSLIPFKVSQAAEMIAESIKTNSGNKRSSIMSTFSSGKATLLNNLEDLKQTCIQSMSQLGSAAATCPDVSEAQKRYMVIAQRNSQRLIFRGVPSPLVSQVIVPNIDGISAESKCKILVGENEGGGSEDIVLEGSWRALSIAEYLLKSACTGHPPLPNPINSVCGEDDATYKIPSKARAGLLPMSSINTADGWDGTIQSSVVNDASSWGRKIGGKACIAGKIPEAALREVGLRWWIPPRYGASPTGSVCDMFCVRTSPRDNAEKLNQLQSLSELSKAIVGESSALSGFPMLSSFAKATEHTDRSVAVSMQRWPSEKVSNKERGKQSQRRSQVGYSPAALQEMQLLTELHSLLPSPQGHPNLILPVAIVNPTEEAVKDVADQKETKPEDDIFSLFRSSEENERRAQTEKRRKDMATGPHLVFHPTPFVLQRIMSRMKKKRDDSSDVVSITPPLLGAWSHDLLSALVHCHTNHVVLRSLQADQLVIDQSGVAKLAGFYKATVLQQNERESMVNPLRSARSRKDLDKGKKKGKSDDDDVASTPFVAPEILLGSVKYTRETDMWSLGCLLANLILGKPLFVGKERSQLLVSMYKIVGSPSKDNYPDGKRFPFFSEPPKKYKRGVEKAFQHMMKEDEYRKNEKAVDLIAQMLHLDPKQRITAVDALQHEYMMQYVEDCNTEAFRQEYVRDWMALKTLLIHSDKTEHASAKRKAMLMATKTSAAATAPDVDDLYDMDDLLAPKSEKRAKLG